MIWWGWSVHPAERSSPESDYHSNQILEPFRNCETTQRQRLKTEARGRATLVKGRCALQTQAVRKATLQSRKVREASQQDFVFSINFHLNFVFKTVILQLGLGIKGELTSELGKGRPDVSCDLQSSGKPGQILPQQLLLMDSDRLRGVEITPTPKTFGGGGVL